MGVHDNILFIHFWVLLEACGTEASAGFVNRACMNSVHSEQKLWSNDWKVTFVDESAASMAVS